jgi:hypothetical protein
MILFLLKYWKNVLAIFSFILIIFLSSLCYIQYKELSLYSEKVDTINNQWKQKIQKLNDEGLEAQRKYDLLEQQHKLKVEALNEKVRQQKAESNRAYNELTVSNDKLHQTIRESTAKLSNLSKEAHIDYSERASRSLKECSERYIEMAKTARDLGIDRDALEDALPSN